MSNSKPLPPFTFEVLCYLNRDQLERFLMVCRPMKNIIERYIRSKPYRVFGRLFIRGGKYALAQINLNHNIVQWHPTRDAYSAQQFLAARKCSTDASKVPSDYSFSYYSFSEMRPYLGPSVRIEMTVVFVAGDSTYNPEHITEMESISYLWRDHKVNICHCNKYYSRFGAEDFQPILNSPTILQCQTFIMGNALFSFKDYKILYTIKFIEAWYSKENFDLNCWLEFLEQPGVKPVVVFHGLLRDKIVTLLDLLAKAFSSDVSPNAFKIVFTRRNYSMTEFRESNKISREKFELKKGLPVEYQKEYLKDRSYTLERAGI